VLRRFRLVASAPGSDSDDAGPHDPGGGARVTPETVVRCSRCVVTDLIAVRARYRFPHRREPPAHDHHLSGFRAAQGWTQAAPSHIGSAACAGRQCM